MRSLIPAIIICMAAGSAVAQTSAPPASLTIVYPNEQNAFHDAAADIVASAYRKLNIRIVYKTYPAERALSLSNKGIADGELVRIIGIDAKYPNLIRIPVSHVTAEQMVFAARPDIKVSGWPSLEPYRIVFHRGYKVAERNTIGMNRFIVSNDQAALKMVSKGRMDVAIANRFSGLDTIKELKLDSVRIVTPPVQTDPLFHYLNVKHRTLVPRVTKILLGMKADGVFDEIMAKHQVPKPFGAK